MGNEPTIADLLAAVIGITDQETKAGLILGTDPSVDTCVWTGKGGVVMILRLGEPCARAATPEEIDMFQRAKDRGKVVAS